MRAIEHCGVWAWTDQSLTAREHASQLSFGPEATGLHPCASVRRILFPTSSVQHDRAVRLASEGQDSEDVHEDRASTRQMGTHHETMIRPHQVQTADSIEPYYRRAIDGPSHAESL
jgi:hypothetical protein